MPAGVLAAALVALAVAVSSGGAGAQPILWGVNALRAPDDARVLPRFAALVGARPAIVMWYQDFSGPLFWPNQLRHVRRSCATPLITWEPETRTGAIPLRLVAAGNFDGYLLRSALVAARTRRPLLVRFAHEMNLRTSRWGAGVNGNTPSDYVAAWRHVVAIFRAHAPNVRFVWSPNVDDGGAPFAQYFPGDAWTDWVALDGYNWGRLKGQRWMPLLEVFGRSYRELTALSARPMMIAETASAELGGSKASWIRHGLLQELPAFFPRVRAVVWFDRDKETDWRVNSSRAALRAFRAVVRSPRYRGAVCGRR